MKIHYSRYRKHAKGKPKKGWKMETLCGRHVPWNRCVGGDLRGVTCETCKQAYRAMNK